MVRRSPLAGKSVVVLPDVYIDAVARLPPWRKVAPRLRGIAERGGGNLPIGPVEVKVGGNAANTALALARLGAQAELVARTDALGRNLLDAAARDCGLGLRHVQAGPTASATLALEMGRANVMLSHAGPLRSFGPGDVTAAAWRAIEAADAVVVTNWSQDGRGTELLAAVADRLRRKGSDAFLFVDTGDLRHRPARDVAGLLRARRAWSRIDAWGLNENELRAATGGTDAGIKAGGLIAAAKALSSRLGCRLDLHTRRWAASVRGDAVVREPAAAGPTPLRLTGAGDAWNAGNVAGQLLALADRDRLRLAHAVAAHYVSARDARPPRASDLPVGLWRPRAGAAGQPGR